MLSNVSLSCKNKNKEMISKLPNIDHSAFLPSGARYYTCSLEGKSSITIYDVLNSVLDQVELSTSTGKFRYVFNYDFRLGQSTYNCRHSSFESMKSVTFDLSVFQDNRKANYICKFSLLSGSHSLFEAMLETYFSAESFVWVDGITWSAPKPKKRKREASKIPSREKRLELQPLTNVQFERSCDSIIHWLKHDSLESLIAIYSVLPSLWNQVEVSIKNAAEEDSSHVKLLLQKLSEVYEALSGIICTSFHQLYPHVNFSAVGNGAHIEVGNAPSLGENPSGYLYEFHTTQRSSELLTSILSLALASIYKQLQLQPSDDTTTQTNYNLLKEHIVLVIRSNSTFEKIVQYLKATDVLFLPSVDDITPSNYPPIIQSRHIANSLSTKNDQEGIGIPQLESSTSASCTTKSTRRKNTFAACQSQDIAIYASLIYNELAPPPAHT